MKKALLESPNKNVFDCDFFFVALSSSHCQQYNSNLSFNCNQRFVCGLILSYASEVYGHQQIWTPPATNLALGTTYVQSFCLIKSQICKIVGQSGSRRRLLVALSGTILSLEPVCVCYGVSTYCTNVCLYFHRLSLYKSNRSREIRSICS